MYRIPIIKLGLSWNTFIQGLNNTFKLHSLQNKDENTNRCAVREKKDRERKRERFRRKHTMVTETHSISIITRKGG